MDWKNDDERRAYHRAWYRARHGEKKLSPRALAKAAGHRTFIPTKPCREGHLSARSMAGGHCIECQHLRLTSPEYRAEQKRRYHADLDLSREKGRLQMKRRREAQSPALRASEDRENEKDRAKRAPGIAARKAYQLARREAKAAAKATAKAEKNAERTIESARLRVAWKIRNSANAKAWRTANQERNRELQKKWRSANPEKLREKKRKRRASKRKSIVDGLMKLQRGRCAYCRAKLAPGTTHVDHIHPLARGGADHRSNLQLACSTCNIIKSDKDPILFAQEIGRLL